MSVGVLLSIHGSAVVVHLLLVRSYLLCLQISDQLLKLCEADGVLSRVAIHAAVHAAFVVAVVVVLLDHASHLRKNGIYVRPYMTAAKSGHVLL